MRVITVGHTYVGSVQFAKPRTDWAAHNAVYVGMPCNASRAFGIADEDVPGFGKPWDCLRDPRGWQVAYQEYLDARLLNDPAFREDVRSLHGKILLCWCLAKAMRQPDFDPARFACHGLILARAVEALAHDEVL